MVDFGSTQVGAKTRRRRVVFINPFADQSLCVPLNSRPRGDDSARARVRVAGGSGAQRHPRAAEAHFLGEYPRTAPLGGGELASARRGVAGGGFGSGRSDWTCLSPYSQPDLARWCLRRGFGRSPHLCVRNNFTTLECATLRGDGDAVKVSVSKTKRTKKQFGNIVKERENHEGLLESSRSAGQQRRAAARGDGRRLRCRA